MKRILLAALLAAVLVVQPADAQQTSIAGQWSGVGLQNEPLETWTVSLSIREDGGGVIAYPSISCGGELTPDGRQGGVRFFRERITYGDCVTNGRIGVYAHAGHLMWFWTAEDTDFPAMSASAVLSRNAPIS